MHTSENPFLLDTSSIKKLDQKDALFWKACTDNKKGYIITYRISHRSHSQASDQFDLFMFNVGKQLVGMLNLNWYFDPSTTYFNAK